jgi:hypothetical protein
LRGAILAASAARTESLTRIDPIRTHLELMPHGLQVTLRPLTYKWDLPATYGSKVRYFRTLMKFVLVLIVHAAMVGGIAQPFPAVINLILED